VNFELDHLFHLRTQVGQEDSLSFRALALISVKIKLISYPRSKYAWTSQHKSAIILHQKLLLLVNHLVQIYSVTPNWWSVFNLRIKLLEIFVAVPAKHNAVNLAHDIFIK
jgi:hypothetical protein